MKRLFNNSILVLFLFSGTATFLSLSCKKDNNATTLTMLQHKWQIVSLNGEAYRYAGHPGDYYDFGTSNQLVRFLGSRYDTLKYQVIDGGSTLRLYLIENNVQTGAIFNLVIESLTPSQLVLKNSGTTSPTNYLIDSLSR